MEKTSEVSRRYYDIDHMLEIRKKEETCNIPELILNDDRINKKCLNNCNLKTVNDKRVYKKLVPDISQINQIGDSLHHFQISPNTTCPNHRTKNNHSCMPHHVSQTSVSLPSTLAPHPDTSDDNSTQTFTDFFKNLLAKNKKATSDQPEINQKNSDNNTPSLQIDTNKFSGSHIHTNFVPSSVSRRYVPRPSKFEVENCFDPWSEMELNSSGTQVFDRRECQSNPYYIMNGDRPPIPLNSPVPGEVNFEDNDGSVTKLEFIKDSDCTSKAKSNVSLILKKLGRNSRHLNTNDNRCALHRTPPCFNHIPFSDSSTCPILSGSLYENTAFTPIRPFHLE